MAFRLPSTLARLLPKAITLPFALGISLALHATTLAVNFGFPDAARTTKAQALEVILVNARSTQRPAEAQALAQARLDGGGNVDAERRAQTPLPSSARRQVGGELEQKQRRVRELEARQQMLLTEARQQSPAVPPAPADMPAKPAPQPSGRDLAASALAMIQLEAEINRNLDEYNKRPRRKFIGTRTDEYRFARYVEEWRQKVERVGTLNYPEAARGRLYGSLVLSLAIGSDGSVQKIEINRSSGHKELDDAARRIVALAAPYAPFPPEIARDTDIVEITRTWSFTRGDALQAR
ncbi:MAG: TonB family protein [Azospira sp.]|jgi:protein TonB|nr:TonB family protein [Azospira sp.]